ncbi:MAG: TolC family protein [Cytophagales bacterium]|nr:TolC family protein [Cytophagales bacterium]
MRLLFVSILAIPQHGFGQPDSSYVSFEAFMHMVRAYHPAGKQAELLIESGDANLRKARGNFDPVIKSDYNQKQFDSKNYYQINSNTLTVPTPLGLELKAGYDNTSGVFLNPENQLPANGLAYAGIAVPLGKGLLFDDRRQAVRQAEVFEKATELERILLLNNLIFDATKAYWDWYSAWNIYEIFDESVSLAEFRLRAVKESYIQGDVPAIDTLEAYILVQNRQLSRNEAAIKMQQAKFEASNYLWSPDLEPLKLSDNSKPIEHEDVTVENPVDEALIASILSGIDRTHPKLQLYYNKLENLNFERKMKAEKVKPRFDINYNLLNQPVAGNPFENYSTNDYKWGFEFSMPILLRKGRGDLQLTKIKMNQTDLDRQQESLNIKNKIKAYEMEINNLFDQIELFKDAVNNYQILLNGEKRKFEEGESSLFIVNSRETGLINAEVKLIELLGKYQKAQAGLIFALGGAEIPT